MTAPSLPPERHTELAEAKCPCGHSIADHAARNIGCCRHVTACSCTRLWHEAILDSGGLDDAKAEAWDEGYAAHRDLVAQVERWNRTEGAAGVDPRPNPYRTALVPGHDHEGGK